MRSRTIVIKIFAHHSSLPKTFVAKATKRTMSLLAQAGNSYQFYATNNPTITNSVTGFLIASIGDVLCQRVLDSWEKKSQREKIVEKIMISKQSAAHYFDGKELEKVQRSGIANIRAPLKTSDMSRGQNSETRVTVKRNILQKVLFRNKIKKAAEVPSVATAISLRKEKESILQAVKEREHPFQWDSVRTIHLGIIRACTFVITHAITSHSLVRSDFPLSYLFETPSKTLIRTFY